MARDVYADVEQYSELRIGGMDMSEIRRQLFEKGYSEDEVTTIVRMIDRAQDKAFQQEASNSRSGFLIVSGGFLLAIGLGLTISTWVRAVQAGGGTYVLMYGAILTGFGSMLAGLAMRRTR